MNSNNSPLEYLAAFSIVSAASVLSAFCLGKYIDKIRREAQRRDDPAFFAPTQASKQ